MNITELLNSGALHRAARAARPSCVDCMGNIHASPERAAFVNWLHHARGQYGENTRDWPSPMRAEYAVRYVPSH